MFYLYVDIEDVLEEYPLVNNWLVLCDELLGRPIEDKYLEVYYSYDYYYPNIKSESLSESVTEMKFDERLKYELSKIRVSLTLKRKKFFLSNRLKSGFIPMYIKSIVTELTKIKMLIECEYHKNKEIIESIPEVDRSIVSFEIIKDGDIEEYNNNIKSFDIDEILDKINNNGIDSLSDDEREYLDNKSKDLE
jgi:hypothetical protein